MSDLVGLTSGGIGRATVRRFAQRGASIALNARRRAGLEAAAREVEKTVGRALVLPLDVTHLEAVEAALAHKHDHLRADRRSLRRTTVRRELAHAHSPQTWLSRHRGGIGRTIAGAAALVGAATLQRV